MISSDDKLNNNISISQSETILKRQHSDEGYCSNPSNVNSPGEEISRPSFKRESNFIAKDYDMNSDNPNEVFGVTEKTQRDGFINTQQVVKTRTNDMFNERRKSSCSARSSLHQAENSAFSPAFPQCPAPSGILEKQNQFCPKTQDLTHERDALPSMQHSDVSHPCRLNSTAFNNPQSFMCKNTQINSQTLLSFQAETFDNPAQARPDQFRRHWSDSAVHQYPRHEIPARNITETPRTMQNFETKSNEYAGHLLVSDNYGSACANEENSEQADCGYKISLADLGLMDTSSLTLSRSGLLADKLDLPQDDTIQRFFRSSEENFSPLSHDSVAGGYMPASVSNNVSDAIDYSMNSVGETALSNANTTHLSHVSLENERYTTEDEAWKSYLENPLTAATSAMMSIHGDEDSAAALGILYDYYKVPQEKRILSRHCEQTEDIASRHQTRRNPELKINGNTAEEDLSMHESDVLKKVTQGQGSFASLDSVGSELAGCGGLAGSEYLSIGHNINEDSRRIPLTPDSAFSESKDSPPQLAHALAFGESAGTISMASARDQRKQCLSVSSIHSRISDVGYNSLQTSIPRVSTVCSLPALSTTREDFYVQEYFGDIFEYTMEAPRSLKQKEGDPTMSYINKGQFYCISLRECVCQISRMKSSRVTSVIQLVFGDSKPAEEQLRHWEYWHERQHTAKQRIIDIADCRESCMIADIDEFAHNAVSFSWNINDVAKIFINCNCLSTDFSAQKGVKGLPLLLQIDTYINNKRTGIPDHRGVCQLKVFCDKGAERKIRDEERKASRKRLKNGQKGIPPSQQRMSLSPVDVKPIISSPSVTPPPSLSSTSSPGSSKTTHKRQDTVYFRTSSDRSTPAVYFIPELTGHSSAIRNHVPASPDRRLSSEASFLNGALTPTSGVDVEQVFLGQQTDCFDLARGAIKRTQSVVSSEEDEFSAPKVARKCETDIPMKVLLYIRKESDDIYDGIMLKDPTLKGLKEAIKEKFDIPAEKISKVLKKSKKGILVNVDDNIVRHYSNEDTFVIDITSEEHNDDVAYTVTLFAV